MKILVYLFIFFFFFTRCCDLKCKWKAFHFFKQYLYIARIMLIMMKGNWFFYWVLMYKILEFIKFQALNNFLKRPPISF